MLGSKKKYLPLRPSPVWSPSLTINASPAAVDVHWQVVALNSPPPLLGLVSNNETDPPCHAKEGGANRSSPGVKAGLHSEAY